MKDKFTVVANDDALKYQVIETASKKVKYEHDTESEALTVCALMNEAFYELLDRVVARTVGGLKEVFEKDLSIDIRASVERSVFEKSNEAVFVDVMAKELSLQIVGVL